MKNAGKHPFPRRAVALATATAVLWTMVQTTSPGAALKSLHATSVLASELLRLELETPEKGGLNGWTRLLVMEAPALAEVDNVTETDGNAVSAMENTEATPQEESVESPTEEAKKETAAEPVPEPETPTEPEEPKTETAATKPLDLSSIKASQIDIDNHTTGISVKAKSYLNQTPALTLQSAEAGPQILIMHTHATEAYTMDGDDIYTESDPARTTDSNYNMIRVGEEMKAVFEDMGLSVLHDDTTYDYPGYNGSYGRSLTGVQTYLDQYPTIQVVLDVHRDALIDANGTAYAKTTTIDGKKVAQVMLVCGTNDAGLVHPDWKNNFTLAVRLQAAMLAVDSTLPRPIDLRSQRFNQHLTPGSLLVEVGTSGNTLQEALAGARLFARAAGEVYLGCVK